MEYRKIEPSQIAENPVEMLNKEWALLTAQHEGKINTMTVSWGTMGVLWRKNIVQVFIRPQRYTKEFVDSEERFTLSFYGEDRKKELTHLGRVSGRDENKIETVGFTPRMFGAAPAFEEARLVLVCKKLYAQPIDPKCFLPGNTCEEENYPLKDYHTMYVGEIEEVYQRTL